MIQSMKEYEKIKLVDVSKEGIEFNTDTEAIYLNHFIFIKNVTK